MSISRTFVGPVPVQVYQAASVGTPSVVLINSGSTTLYLGQAGVTAADGFPFPANTKITYPWAPWNLYAVSGSTTTTPSTTLSAAAAAGATSVSITSASGFSTGMTVTVGSGEDAETNRITNIVSTTVTLANALEFDHASGATFAADASASSTVGGGTITVHAGVH